MKIFSSLLFVVFFIVGCENSVEKNKKTPKKMLDRYTSNHSKDAFKQAVDLDDLEEDIHILGRSFFTIPWVEAPSATTARDGLGPLYSANSCVHCHPNNGAGTPMKNGVASRSLVMRLSIPDGSDTLRDTNGFIPEPMYGGQLSLHGTSNTKYEGRVTIDYETLRDSYDDNSSYELQNPSYTITNLQYGALHQDVNIAPHIALALVGLGAIEQINERDILKNEDINDSDSDGISGKANWVFNPESNRTELGRFTWKASAATVKQQVANAAHNDMGLTNPLYPHENCTQKQSGCLEENKGGELFDLLAYRLDAIAFYLKTLRIPQQRRSSAFEEGKKIFEDLACVKCHIPEFTLANGEKIQPYSDFLLHDMGEGLSDGHTIFRADANEFRTPPLWGMGLYEKTAGSLALLHDGRARTIEEAILWHGGEATQHKMQFKALQKKNRDQLVEFLKGI